MKINSLTIKDYKCLNNVTINFDERATILLGENGSGKSSIIEAICKIFVELEGHTRSSFDKMKYKIDYICNGHNIVVDYLSKEIKVKIDGEKRTLKALREKGERDFSPYLPQKIITYYSGIENKLENIVNKSLRFYKMRLTQSVNDVKKYSSATSTRRFYTIEHRLAGILLFSILADDNCEEKRILKDFIGLNGDVVLNLIVNEKNQTPKNKNLNLNIDADVDFEKQMFFKLAARIDEDIAKILRRKWIKNWFHKQALLFKISTKDFNGIDKFRIYHFFETVLDYYYGFDYGFFVDFKGTNVLYQDLSEGQRQLISVISMIAVFNQRDSLILLDEPDTHLNAKWKHDYWEMLRDVTCQATDSQVLLATHDPLMVNGVKKEEVRLFEQDAKGNTKIYIPLEDTFGMGVDGILQSEYYGLLYTVDKSTQEKIDRRRELLIKKENGELSREELLEYKGLTEILERTFFTKNMPSDNYYDDFLVALQKIEGTKPKKQLTVEEVRERNNMILQIVKDLIEK